MQKKRDKFYQILIKLILHWCFVFKFQANQALYESTNKQYIKS
jgi:hypothetical protein